MLMDSARAVTVNPAWPFPATAKSFKLSSIADVHGLDLQRDCVGGWRNSLPADGPDRVALGWHVCQ